ncbi:GTP-dependent dephospho-CoA kinase family protein [Methanobrevibacter sp.]|uniref:GTP-dependent dephospho-CoA kinase family protein n=1 Tax=Methanobrevibacter sp. TaxID=66852 RepID=UPI00388DEC8C
MLRLDAELNKDIIIELKKPLGKLYPDFEDAIDEIKSSKFLISVGDATFANLLEYELYPNLAIIDNLIQRKNYNHDVIHTENILKANNPAGTITDDLWETIGKALELCGNGECYVIDVAGEEDLAVLPCILMASEDTTILYGQPNEGLVVLNVSDTIDKAQTLIDAFIEE